MPGWTVEDARLAMSLTVILPDISESNLPRSFIMDVNIIRERLLQIVVTLNSPPSNMTKEEVDQLIEDFASSIPHPGGTDLLYYPEYWGLPEDPPADLIVDEALSWRPRIVAIRVGFVRPHPSRGDLCCIGVELPNSVCTQVVSSEKYRVGDVCVVALSGVRLHSGRVVEHGFVDKAFTAGEILGTSDEAPGTESSATDFPNC